MSNHDPYSDSSRALVVKQPKFTRVGGRHSYEIKSVLVLTFPFGDSPGASWPFDSLRHPCKRSNVRLMQVNRGISTDA